MLQRMSTTIDLLEPGFATIIESGTKGHKS